VRPARGAQAVTPEAAEPRADGHLVVAPDGRQAREPARREGLVIRGVSRRYRSRTVLKGVDLQVDPGTSVLVTGPNGAGKTTLLRIAAGVITPDRGSVSVSGLEPEANRREYQRRVGFLSAGDRALYARLSVRQNLDFWARLALLPRPKRVAAIERAIDHFELAEFAGRRTDRLSMGQRQRTRLAMAFMHEPALVLLDEPTTSLDQDGIELVVHACEEHTARGGAILWCAPTGDHGRLPADRAYEISDGWVEAR